LYLDDILEAIDHIREYTLGLDYEAFQRDRKTQDTVIRNLEIIGEAAGRLPESLRATAPERRSNGEKLPACAIYLLTNISA
jgi:uncharacterized protein with HEPN domain